MATKKPPKASPAIQKPARRRTLKSWPRPADGGFIVPFEFPASERRELARACKRMPPDVQQRFTAKLASIIATWRAFRASNQLAESPGDRKQYAQQLAGALHSLRQLLREAPGSTLALLDQHVWAADRIKFAVPPSDYLRQLDGHLESAQRGADRLASQPVLPGRRPEHDVQHAIRLIAAAYLRAGGSPKASRSGEFHNIVCVCVRCITGTAASDLYKLIAAALKKRVA